MALRLRISAEPNIFKEPANSTCQKATDSLMMDVIDDMHHYTYVIVCPDTMHLKMS